MSEPRTRAIGFGITDGPDDPTPRTETGRRIVTLRWDGAWSGQATVDDILAIEAEGLDVEVLARALPDYLLDTENGILHREPIAQQIAARYRVLTAEKKP